MVMAVVVVVEGEILEVVWTRSSAGWPPGSGSLRAGGWWEDALSSERWAGLLNCSRQPLEFPVRS